MKLEFLFRISIFCAKTIICAKPVRPSCQINHTKKLREKKHTTKNIKDKKRFCPNKIHFNIKSIISNKKNHIHK